MWLGCIVKRNTSIGKKNIKLALRMPKDKLEIKNATSKNVKIQTRDLEHNF